MKWYKRDPDAALIGFRGLSHDAKSAYGTIIDLSYSRDGDVPDDEQFLCTHIECRPQWWRRVKAELIACGKLRVIDGKLVANRVETVLKLARERGVSMRNTSKINEGHENKDFPRIENRETTTSFPTAARESAKRKKKEAEKQTVRSLASALPSGALPREPKISASLEQIIKAKGWKQ